MPPALPSNLRLFAPRFGAALGTRVAQALGTKLSPVEERNFDGGEQKMRPLEDVEGCDVFVVSSLDGDGELSANDKLCRLLFFIGALKDAGAAKVTACVPYLCYARKDRRTHPGDPVSTRYVAAMFEAVGTHCVVTIDVHNEAAFDNAFRLRTVRIDSAELFTSALANAVDVSRCVVVSPDIGGVKRAQRLREALASSFKHEVGFAFMEKRRFEGVVSGDALIGDVADRDLVIHDDMIVSGGTIARATRAARAAGARKIVVAAAHAPLTAEARQLFDKSGPDLILISDAVTLPKEFAGASQFRVCGCAEVLAKTIRHLAIRG